jgi:hypothetical protein
MCLMRRFSILLCVVAALAIAIAGYGAVSQTPTKGVASMAAAHPGAVDPPRPAGHPQAIEPVAGVRSAAPAEAPTTIVGDPTAHAPSLAQVKRELTILNICGGATSSAFAQPLITSLGAGFTPDPGTQQTEGQLPQLTQQLDALGKALGVTIYGISGYRTPAHSVAVGGFANDPHTRGQAEDIGVGSLLRSSAAQISEAELAKFGLYRPFDPSGNPSNPEVNHIQLIPTGGPLSLAQAATAWSRDPRCQ